MNHHDLVLVTEPDLQCSRYNSERILSAARGELSNWEITKMTEHLDDCSFCRDGVLLNPPRKEDPPAPTVIEPIFKNRLFIHRFFRRRTDRIAA